MELGRQGDTLYWSTRQSSQADWLFSGRCRRRDRFASLRVVLRSINRISQVPLPCSCTSPLLESKLDMRSAGEVVKQRRDGAQERVIRGFEPHCGEPDYASASGAQPE